MIVLDRIEPGKVVEYCWASEAGLHGAQTPEALEDEGWTRVRRHPWYHAAWLMRRNA